MQEKVESVARVQRQPQKEGDYPDHPVGQDREKRCQHTEQLGFLAQEDQAIARAQAEGSHSNDRGSRRRADKAKHGRRDPRSPKNVH